jgi:hypothetical protein
VRVRVDVDREPLAPGAAVSGRVVVEQGGRARSLSVRLAFVERTESFEKAARDAGTLVVAEGDLAEGVVLAFSLRLPDDALPNIASGHGAHRLGAARPHRSRGPGPDRRPADRAAAELHCPRLTGRGGRVAEGTRLLSEYGV